MNVLHINSYDHRGGSETVFNLSRFNPNVEKNYFGFVKVSKNNLYKSHISFRSWENDNKLLGACNYIYSKYNAKVLEDFLLKNKIDIIHLHNIFSALSPSIFVVLRKLKFIQNFKVVQTVHDYHLICPNANLFNYKSNRICKSCVGKKLKYHIIFKNCDRRGWIFSVVKGVRNFISNNIINYENIIDKFITPSNFLKNELIEDGIDKEKLVLIRNPIIPKHYNRNTIKKNIICYFGRLSPEKNVSFLVDAFIKWKELKKNNYQMVIIGEGEEEEIIKKKALKSFCSDSILIKPYIPNDELYNEIINAKYFSMASKWYENAPMVIIEAFSAGLIPIVPDIGGMKESIENIVKVGRTYKLGDINSWINAMDELELIYDSEYLKLIKSLGIVDDYYLEKYLVNLNNLYIELSNKLFLT